MASPDSGEGARRANMSVLARVAQINAIPAVARQERSNFWERTKESRGG